MTITWAEKQNIRMMQIVIDQDEQLIFALKGNVNDRNSAIKSICRTPHFRHKICNYVKSNGGTDHEALEVFHDSILNLVKSVINGKYDTEYSIRNYLFGIARHLWLKKYRKRVNNITRDLPDEFPNRDEILPDILLVEEDRKNAVRELMVKVGSPCKEALTWWATGYRTHEIAKKMRQSENYTRLQIHRCKRRMEKLLDANPELLNRLKE